ncbi:MAG: DUF763 domain-containing protein [Planctomycetota bacterium]
MKRTGVANLPLHSGKAPAWLFGRMKKLAREVTLWIVEEFGPNEVLERLSDPFWFQAFGCALGFDWHSSGVTTTVCGAMKDGLKDVSHEIGLYVAGGKGGRSRKTPQEIETVCDAISLDAAPLVYASRLSAKVDNAAVQDGYQVYQHCFIFTKAGSWCVVQQGMNEATGYARRYHWLGEHVSDFVCEPHDAVCCDRRGEALNMVASESAASRDASTEIAKLHPDKVMTELKKAVTLDMPRRHMVLLSDVESTRMRKIFLHAYEGQPENFERLLGIQGVGPKTIRSLSLLGELIYGKRPSFRDPARFSFAHGGKDGFPYPVDRATYDRSIEILRTGLRKAKIDCAEREGALRRLAAF